jgi:hypothetical protein
LRSTAPLAKAILRSCMLRSAPGSIGGAASALPSGPAFWSERGVAGGAARSLALVDANKWLVRAASVS